MSVSTDAILFYGYWWDEETRNPWQIGDGDEATDEVADNEEDWETRYARLKGCLPPSTPFPERTVKLVEIAPCLVDTHCSDSCPMPYVAVRASVMNSSRGQPSKITSLAVDPTWNAALVFGRCRSA